MNHAPVWVTHAEAAAAAAAVAPAYEVRCVPGYSGHVPGLEVRCRSAWVRGALPRPGVGVGTERPRAHVRRDGRGREGDGPGRARDV